MVRVDSSTYRRQEVSPDRYKSRSSDKIKKIEHDDADDVEGSWEGEGVQEVLLRDAVRSVFKLSNIEEVGTNRQRNKISAVFIPYTSSDSTSTQSSLD